VGVHEVFKTDIAYYPCRIPPQAFIANRSEMTCAYAKQVFSQAEIGVIQVQHNDTILLYIDGVVDSMGQGELLKILGDTYQNWACLRKEPQDLAKDIVNRAIHN